jgi:hypothetical protein
MMLSIPRTISRNVNVNSAIQASGFKNTSILFYYELVINRFRSV